jgi:hypothetical protein
MYLGYYRYEHWHHGLPLITAALGTLILVATMIIRRPPKRVTPNPWDWLPAFVATYWLKSSNYSHEDTFQTSVSVVSSSRFSGPPLFIINNLGAGMSP